jgi:hypothetical protein
VTARRAAAALLAAALGALGARGDGAPAAAAARPAVLHAVPAGTVDLREPRSPLVAHPVTDRLTGAPFRPAADPAAYARWKALAGARAPAVRLRPRPAAAAPAPDRPVVLDADFAGVGQLTACGFCLPPDTHGAAGREHYVEVTNSHLDVWERAGGRRVVSVSLYGFFGWTETTVFDPRAVYDADAGRWYVAADSDAASPTVQYVHLAVSRTADPVGEWDVYRIDVAQGAGGTFFDFPQLGVDRRALVLTGDVFAGAGEGEYLGSDVLVIPKAELLAGGPVPLQRFEAVAGATIAPPIVLDDAPRTYLVSADVVSPAAPSRALHLLALETSGEPGAATVTPLPDVAVGPYAVPPPARQPDVKAQLDTLDGRFVNASTQRGRSLWQVHTIADDGFARGRYYRIDTDAGELFQSGPIGRSDTSFDFNMSIAANDRGTAFVTWSSTDPADDRLVQVRFSGRQNDDPKGSMNLPGRLLYASPEVYRPSIGSRVRRWGDYSAVAMDPVDPGAAWIVNEAVPHEERWGSRIARIGFAGTTRG